jgi:hypothetical protein
MFNNILQTGFSINNYRTVRLDNFTYFWGGLLGGFAVMAAPLTTTNRSYLLFNIARYTVKFIFFSTLGYNVAYGSL